MDIAKIPIVDFLRFCKQGAHDRGFYWIVCILSRASDSRGLYRAIERDWQSLDSITGQRMLVLLAGNEIQAYDKHYNLRSCLTDKREAYVQRYNPFATVIGTMEGIKADLSSVRYSLLKNSINAVEASQTDAIDSLKRYLGIKEKDIPCLVYIPLYQTTLPVENIVVPFPRGEVDLYFYFKRLYEEISPLVDALSPHSDLTKRIDNTYEKLISLVNRSSNQNKLLECIENRTYYKDSQPIRGLLSRYIDLCRFYKEKQGEDYVYGTVQNDELLILIKEAFQQLEIPIVEKMPVNAYISIGDGNIIKKSQISVEVKVSD